MENKLLKISQFASVMFVADELFEYIKDELINYRLQALSQKYNYQSLNRSGKTKADKAIKKEIEAYLKKLNLWGNMLKSISTSFYDSSNKGHQDMHNITVDLIFRALSSIKIGEEKVVKDDFKSYLFESLDNIEAKERTPEEVVKLKNSFDNFLVLNRV